MPHENSINLFNLARRQYVLETQHLLIDVFNTIDVPIVSFYCSDYGFVESVSLVDCTRKLDILVY